MTTKFTQKCFSLLSGDMLFSSVFFFFCAFSFAQQEFEFSIPDSLQPKSYIELKASFDADKKDSLSRYVYAKSYIAKATQDDNRLEMTKGYELLGFAHHHNYRKSFSYYDKAIEISKNLNNKHYPAILYIYKGAILSEKNNYKEALENHLKALEYAEANNNVELAYVTKHNIAILKKHLELYDEALEIFKECYEYEVNNPDRDEYDFLQSHFSLAEIYIEKNTIDSAVKYNTKGYNLALKLDKRYCKSFILNEGLIAFHKKNYRQTIEKISKVVDSLGDEIPTRVPMNGFFHLAKAYDSLKQKEKAVVYYKKVDSIFTAHPYSFTTNLIDTYKALFSYYRATDDKANEAYYIDKALLASDIYKEDYRALSNKIIKTFDRRDLLEKQKELNKALNQKDKKYSTLKLFAFIFIALFSIAIIVFYYKQRQIKRRFQELVEKHEKAVKAKQNLTQITNEDEKQIGLADDIIEQILVSLCNFEEKHTYIKPDITLPNLSKRFKTNSAYLSRVINTYKNKKFAEYLNDLRVDYAIEKIQSDKHFRLYTIKAIAIEVGFNNSQSFARAFKRKTGIKPSDFIKQLESIST
ncbi:helix-turn-helix domain-containing protein [Kordia sp.]|uniref:helix-turn-helix domain-containing protein n=1 Tax=Kordia sp. TaxID=1965332 RepID=UPI0025C634B9|nr:helix-turn-helix domain-containing protein [Kordia sp.]MCH2193007.1 helix-turn-helix domain-containing protein [Kordia sp.]